MKISDLDQPRIGDIVEFETDPETVVEGLIVGETEDGYIYEFSESGYTELDEACTYGKYYCSTDKKYKCRQGPKQDRDVSEGLKDWLGKKLDPNNVPGFSEYFPDVSKYVISQIMPTIQFDKFGRSLATPFEAGTNDHIIKDSLENYFIKAMGPREALNFINKNGKLIRVLTSQLQVALDSEIIKKEKGVSEAHPNSKIYDKCWDGYKKVPGKKRGEKGSCVEESAGYIAKNSAEAKDPRFSTSMTVDVGTDTMRNQLEAFFPTEAPADGQEQVTEAQYQGREVPLGRPMRGDVKKFKVYVKDPKTGNVKKVNFGDPNMRIKKSNPARRKSFRARHNCKNPGPRTKARYWSCRKW